MNNWGIPTWLEQEVKVRDLRCVYCGVEMLDEVPRGASRKAVATWEHIINDASIVARENIARCCASCNSSKGAKALVDWLQSPYCKDHGITEDTVADVVKKVLESARGQESGMREPI